MRTPAVSITTLGPMITRCSISRGAPAPAIPAETRRRRHRQSSCFHRPCSPFCGLSAHVCRRSRAIRVTPDQPGPQPAQPGGTRTVDGDDGHWHRRPRRSRDGGRWSMPRSVCAPASRRRTGGRNGHGDAGRISSLPGTTLTGGSLTVRVGVQDRVTMIRVGERMAAADAQLWWLSAKVPNDRFCWYVFVNAGISRQPCPRCGATRRASMTAHPIRDDTLCRYPRWIREGSTPSSSWSDEHRASARVSPGTGGPV